MEKDLTAVIIHQDGKASVHSVIETKDVRWIMRELREQAECWDFFYTAERYDLNVHKFEPSVH